MLRWQTLRFPSTGPIQVKLTIRSMLVSVKEAVILGFAYICRTQVNTALGLAHGLSPLFPPVFLTATFVPLFYCLPQPATLR